MLLQLSTYITQGCCVVIIIISIVVLGRKFPGVLLLKSILVQRLLKILPNDSVQKRTFAIHHTMSTYCHSREMFPLDMTEVSLFSHILLEQYLDPSIALFLRIDQVFTLLIYGGVLLLH